MAKSNRKFADQTSTATAEGAPTATETQGAPVETVVLPNDAGAMASTIGAEQPGQTAAELILKYGNKSKAIRALSAEGKSRSEVAKLLGIRYQHVNNVLKQILKREIKAERDAKAEAVAEAKDATKPEAAKA